MDSAHQESYQRMSELEMIFALLEEDDFLQNKDSK